MPVQSAGSSHWHSFANRGGPANDSHPYSGNSPLTEKKVGSWVQPKVVPPSCQGFDDKNSGGMHLNERCSFSFQREYEPHRNGQVGSFQLVKHFPSRLDPPGIHSLFAFGSKESVETTFV